MPPDDTLRHDREDGSSVLVAPFNDKQAAESIAQQLRNAAGTPSPSSSYSKKGGGPVPRTTTRRAKFGIQLLRTIGLQSHEIGNDVRKRRDELYRNDFPVLEPRFTAKCEDCGTELQESPDECPSCGSGDLRRPDPEERRAAEELFESVNREGQSLRELAKYCEPDQWLAGVSCIVVQYEYHVAQNSAFYQDGEVIAQEPQELVYGDPASIKPVVDDEGRVGGHWYTCPLHRANPSGKPGHCSDCGAELRDVYFVDKSKDDPAYYFRDEVVTWAYPQPELNGLDGLAPTAGVMLRQVVIEMMVRYGAAFYDQNSDRLPNQFMVLHTTNPDHWEEQLNRIRSEDDAYDSPILSNEYSPQDSSVPEIQVVDAMPDEMLGQSRDVKKDYKEDIRQATGVSNVHDSDLKDAGGLNNEGLQLEVTDRSIASQQKDYREGWLDTLCKRLGITDWQVAFIPAREDERDPLEQQREVRAGQLAAESGLDARWEDGELVIEDGDFEAPERDTPKTESDVSAATTPQPGRPGVDDVESAASTLGDVFEHVVWADGDDVEQAAQPFWSRDEDVPENVKRHIRTAIARTDLTMADDISASSLQPFFREKLLQRQGWSLQSLTRDLVDREDLETDYAQSVVRSGVARILNQAKYQAYAELEGGSDEEILYYWRGPEDDSTSQGCHQLKEATNPDYGGTPRPLGEFRSLQRDIHDEHFAGLEFDDAALHPNERHTIEAIPASAL
ncbi:hypothetical protein U3A55_11855 [Salarchaeum sp. III]|uniref:hypothetical protein n=1 Tax=Salarchaeum sp. III TaxID=3107927 RepID=UPI002EDAFC0F